MARQKSEVGKSKKKKRKKKKKTSVNPTMESNEDKVVLSNKIVKKKKKKKVKNNTDTESPNIHKIEQEECKITNQTKIKRKIPNISKSSLDEIKLFLKKTYKRIDEIMEDNT